MTGFPSPLDDDPEDVRWGLTTGAALWKRGERYDAIVWLKRAVEAALEAGQGGRADELNHAATDLIAALAARAAQGRSASDSSGSMKVAPPRPPPPPPAAARAAAAPGRPPLGSRSPAAPPRPPPASAPRAGGRPLPPPKPPPPRAGAFPPPSVARLAPARSPAPPPPALLAEPRGEMLPVRDVNDTLPEPRFGFDEEPPTIERALTPDLLESAIGSGLPPMPPPSDSRQAAVTEPLLDALAAESPPDDAAPESAEEAPLEPEKEEPIESADELLAAAEQLLGPPADELPTPAAPEVAEPPAPALPFSLDGVRALDALSPEQRIEVIRLARIDTLALDEEIKVAGLVLVLEGEAAILSAITDVPAARLKAGDVIYARGSIPEILPLRVSATTDSARVAAWEQRAIEEVLGRPPGLLEALQQASDRTQALAGSTIGPIGERLDENLRALAIERLQIRVLQPEEILAEGGKPVPGLVIVGVGSVQVEVEGELRERLGPGDFLFATEVLGGGKAPGTARAGAKGATVLFGKRGLAQELLVTCPPLLEIFAGM